MQLRAALALTVSDPRQTTNSQSHQHGWLNGLASRAGRGLRRSALEKDTRHQAQRARQGLDGLPCGGGPDEAKQNGVEKASGSSTLHRVPCSSGGCRRGGELAETLTDSTSLGWQGRRYFHGICILPPFPKS